MRWAIALPMRRWLFTVLLAFNVLADAPNERDHIVIDLKRQWHFSGFSPGQIKVADNYSMSLSGEYPKFACNEPGARATWQYNFDLPIEMSTFPTFTLKY